LLAESVWECSGAGEESDLVWALHPLPPSLLHHPITHSHQPITISHSGERAQQTPRPPPPVRHRPKENIAYSHRHIPLNTGLTLRFCVHAHRPTIKPPFRILIDLLTITINFKIHRNLYPSTETPSQTTPHHVCRKVGRDKAVDSPLPDMPPPDRSAVYRLESPSHFKFCNDK